MRLDEVTMSEELSVLVCGIGEEASATARTLFAEGYAVALHRSTAPLTLRRRMCYADAWYDGYAQLDGVEVRRADVNAEFMLGLRTRDFIPLLRGGLDEALGRWPWNVVIVAKEDREPEPAGLCDLAELVIGLGREFSAGADCDLAIEIEGHDPGAIVGPGEAAPKSRAPRGAPGHALARAPAAGLFRAQLSIGASVEAGATLGFVGDAAVLAPAAGRIKGVARKEQAVTDGSPVVEIALNPSARVAGVSSRNKLIARGVAFAIEMENEGIEPLSFENWR
jgi:xanthine dehydrogenase accessory factor